MKPNKIYPKYVRPSINAMSYPALVYEGKVEFEDARIPDLIYEGQVTRTELIKHITKYRKYGSKSKNQCG